MSSNASTTSTTRKARPPRHLVQNIDGDAKAKLQQVAIDGRIAGLVRKDATHYLQRQRLEGWLRAVEAVTLPLGPALLPKSVKNITAWRALTPAQQAERKTVAIEAAKADVERKRAERRNKNVRPNQEG